MILLLKNSLGPLGKRFVIIVIEIISILEVGSYTNDNFSIFKQDPDIGTSAKSQIIFKIVCVVVKLEFLLLFLYILFNPKRCKI